ncbi:ATP-binding protein [Blastopirellula marina]|uniref:histidine kinase n=1 Tax=Blastopirellula marina DSM 3645 TaxID=314230 RepID=A3ZZY1_9BACT|nr:ATP-binding protein [Blastopirellula marina]EAQ77925.1 Response regulator receiver:ATP-binding region,ATPase-like:Histidine kinase, HAMP region:Histidine [Blastopirellula marina DSM 3645]
MPTPPFSASTRRLTTLYIAALSIVALLSISGQVLVQQSIDRQQGDSTLVNIAGRQRMLSQRIAKSALVLRDQPDQQTEALQQLRESLDLWKESHQQLLDRDAAQAIGAANSSTVLTMFAAIEQDFREIQTSARRLLESPDDEQIVAQAVANIMQREQPYLHGMDRIVFQYDEEASLRVARLRRIESLLLGLTLFVLLLEGLFIFRPAVGEIRRNLDTQSQMTEQLQTAKVKAEEANRVKTDFLAKMSHEIRTPMNAILGLSQSLTESIQDERQRRQAIVVNDSARSLMSLLNDLLDVSRLEIDARKPVTAEPFHLASLIRRTQEMFALQAQQQGIKFPIQIDPALEVIVLGDELRTRQILTNLIQNALKFVDDGFIAVEATTSAEDETSLSVNIAVRDSGPGIPEDQLERIFDAFSQLGNSSNSQRGVGLGLHISKRLAGELGGRLTVHSEVGVGSEFCLQLRFHRSDAISANVPAVRMANPDLNLKILVVEDIEANQLVLQEMLDKLGLVADFASDGRSALHALQISAYDVVLLDLELPDISGLDVARQIRQKFDVDNLWLVAVTAHAVTSYKTSAIKAGVNKFLTKPIGFDELRVCLAQAPASKHTPIEITEGLRMKLISLFLEHSPASMNELRQAYQDQDQRRVVFLAHRLRGMLVYFDRRETSSLLAQLDREDLVLSNDRTAEILHDLEISIAQLQQDLSAQLAESR